MRIATAWIAPAIVAVCCGQMTAAEPPQIYVNSLGMKLVHISAGEFMMGSTESAADLKQAFALTTELAVADEQPVHKVRITRPFYLGAYEVTVGEFKAFVEATGYRTNAETNGKGGSGWTGKGFGKQPEYNWRNWWKDQTDKHPVINVSWKDAVAFCKWLSEKEGRKYRLPTEAEWEYACRAGTTTRFSWGDDVKSLPEFANFADPRGKPPGTVLTTAVGSFRPNVWGLFDMHGNVLEWCSDWHQPTYYEKSPAADPTGPAMGGTRVVRGGGWGFNPAYGRSARRGRIDPGNCGYRDGFRVVCEAPAE